MVCKKNVARWYKVGMGQMHIWPDIQLIGYPSWIFKSFSNADANTDTDATVDATVDTTVDTTVDATVDATANA